MMPAQVLTPVARWSQMAALGAAICKTLNQLWKGRNIGIQALQGLMTIAKRPGRELWVP